MARTAAPHPILVRALALLAVLALAGLAAAPVRPAAAQASSPTTTPQADTRPDGCEPNDTQANACRIDLDAVSGPFTFLPEGDVDTYSIFLGAQPDGLETSITLRATSGLDVATTIRRAEGGAALATIASPRIEATLGADVTGWVVLRVENRGAAIASGQSYRIEVRRTLPPTQAAAPTASGPAGLTRDPAAPDALENNYSPETAAPIAVGVLYDLNFVCPVVDGCAGGDHDYLKFDVKAGGRYLISTFDLADGVDTALDLFWWSPAAGWQLLAANDDTQPGAAFLSTMRWQAPADGIALVRVGPRDGGLNPVIAGAPSYRFAIALAGSPLAVQLEARIAQQTNQPTPTPSIDPTADTRTPPGGAGTAMSPTPVAPTAVVIVAGAVTGRAQVIAATLAHTDPDAASPALGTIAADAVVSLTGRVAGLWVEVTHASIVGAAWVDRRALRPTTGPAPAETPALDQTPGIAGPPIPTPEALPAATGAPIAGGTPSPSNTTASAHVVMQITQGGQPVRGLRVLLVTVLDTTLSEQVTADDGTTVFDAQIAVGAQVEVVIPALGLRIPVDAATPVIAVTLPEAS